ncbi:uncharacterized protein LOC123546493 [Mercenaria mercenaria]|uniref:uncharacterized protein LOC123546493 n=1 Tax=Mercenaria mercenaria TaxID=6596 RepID=UPI00234F9549|nr:uncharacterized protein LOC123546493 [Mercenaria mercenaria]XP_045188771.2 uncharacterized protein LOC123546493 [Mercenaria mercenaria]XP_045188780.2 uncharacterized protein LOC123546493 [Mercenaria mercenaria]
MIMEYCPEIAVLQSAFQLVSEKAGKLLSDLPKEKCHEYVNIISTSVDEICEGIEHDLDLEEKLLWQQKLHTVILYVLVKKKYKEKEEQRKEGKVPVCGVLDMFTEILPTYSSSFYFELMKHCGWTGQFLQSLQCLDYKIASSLFDALLLHCHSDPLTLEDCKVITVVKDKLLSRCLCVPDYPSELCVKLLEPLTQSREYVQTLYPEEVEIQAGKPVTMVTKNSNRVGIHFWNIYVEKNPHILDTVMTNFENVLENLNEGSVEKGNQELLETVSQLGIWLHLSTMKPDSDVSDKWLINNLFVPNCDVMPDGREYPDIVYSLNFTLLQTIFSHFPQRRLLVCLQKALTLLSDLFKNEDNGDGNKNLDLSLRFKQTTQIVSGLSVNLSVLLRMLTGLMTITESLGTVVEKYGVPEDLQTEIEGVLSRIQEYVTDTVAMETGLVQGDTWIDDVTLESLLWRVDYKLPQYQVCVDRLLEDKNIQFWITERLYCIMRKYPSLLSRVDRVLKLSQILDILYGTNCEKKTASLFDLITAAFSELSFPEQDTVVMKMYCTGHSSVQDFFKKDLERKVTNVFNKITADMENQVLSEVILLCLGDPGLVLRTAVSLCVRNEQQAQNCALIMQQLHKTCTCCHQMHHPEMSLVTFVVCDFLSLQPLSEKEQKCFCIFISELMMPRGNFSCKGSTMSPPEFLHTSVLRCITVDNLWSTNTVTCKFAAELLLLTLEAGCYKNCDWSEYEFEPIALVLSLAEMKHECVVLWEMQNQLLEEEGKAVGAMETSTTKLALKEAVNKCLDMLRQMIIEKNISIQHADVQWLQVVTADLHWTVKLGLCPLFSACNFEQYTDEWLCTLDGLLEDPSSNLVSILQFVAVDRMFIQRIVDNLTQDTELHSEDIIHALIQVLPQCLMNEFERVVMFVEELQKVETLHISLVYRLQSTVNLPLLDFSELRPALYTSQLLGDVILALVMTLPSEEELMPMLHYVVQCYVSVMKTRCEKVIESREMQVFYLGELFHHACQVTLHLPAEIMDSTLVFLLHILNKFKDVTKGMVKGQKVKERNDRVGIKLVKNMENGMMSAVQSLPDSCEEKNMLLKKLGNQL